MNFQTFGEGLSQPESFAGGGLSSEARSFVSNRLRVDQSNVEYSSGFVSGRGTRHAYVRQRAVSFSETLMCFFEYRPLIVLL